MTALPVYLATQGTAPEGVVIAPRLWFELVNDLLFTDIFQQAIANAATAEHDHIPVQVEALHNFMHLLPWNQCTDEISVRNDLAL